MVRPQLLSLEDRSTPAIIGNLDPTFGSSGLTTVPFDLGGTNTDLGAAIAVQPDGKIVVVGSTQTGAADVDFAVARLNVDGSLDKTFGSNGIRAIGIDLGGSKIDRATSVAIQSDGKIVVGGYAQADAATDYDFAVIRLTTAGDLDATFDGDGRQTVAFDTAGGTQDDKAAGVAIDSQGRIVLAGTVAAAAAGDTDFCVARLTTAGALDKTFDADGRQVIGFDRGGLNADTAASVVIDSQDRILIAGGVQISNFGDFDFGVARLKTDGSLDASFDGDGRQTVAFDVGGTNADTAAALALDAGERVVVVGAVAIDATDVDVGVTRLTADGSLDTSFGSKGILALGFDLGGNKQDRGTAVAINGLTGDIVISATADTPTAGDTDIGVMRLTSDGSFDPSFSEDGRAVVAFDRGGANADTSGGVALDARGRVLVVGSVDTTNANDRDLGVARIIGSTGLANNLLVGGPTTGQADNFVPVVAGYAKTGSSAGPDPLANVRPVVADLNGDGFPDQILGAGPGSGSRVRVILGIDPALAPVSQVQAPIDFDAFEGNFTGGVFVAAGDVDGDGRDEFVVSPDVGGGPRASVFSLEAGNTLVKRADFFGIDDPNFRGGARVALGDINRDARADLVVGAGFLGGPRVAIFNGATLFASATPQKLVGDFFAFPGADAQTLRNGVFVTVGDLDGDGFAEVIFGGGPGGGPRVFALSGQLLTNQLVDQAYGRAVVNFFVGNDGNSRGGVRLAVKDIDGDDRADLVTASGDGLPSKVRVYRGSTVPQLNGVEPPLLQEFDPFGTTLANGVFVG